MAPGASPGPRWRDRRGGGLVVDGGCLALALDPGPPALGVEAPPPGRLRHFRRLALGVLGEGLGEQLGEALDGGLAIGELGAVALRGDPQDAGPGQARAEPVADPPPLLVAQARGGGDVEGQSDPRVPAVQILDGPW